MRNRISTAVAAGALVLSAAGATLLIPGLVAAADPTTSPAATTAPSATTAPGANPGTTTPDTNTTADCSGMGGTGGMGSDDVTAAAGALGMTEDEVTTALSNGQTLAEMAADQGVDVQKVIDAMVAAETAEIQAKVTDGTITQAEADQRIADLTAHETDEVNGVAPMGGPGEPGGHGRHGGQPPSAPSTTAPTTTDTTTTTTTS